MSDFLGRPRRRPGDDVRPARTAAASRADRWRSAGRFGSARQTLAALGSLYAAGAADWVCHRGPGGARGEAPAYWLLTTAHGPVAADVIALHGGEPVPVDSPRTHDLGEVRSWPEVTAVELLAAFPTHGPPTMGHPLLYVLTAPALLRTVVRHARSAQADISLVRASARPLFPRVRPGTEEERLLVLLSAPADPALDHSAPEAPDRAVPGGLVHSLVSLPRTSVCRPAAHCARLLLDVRHDPPLDEELLRPAIADGELWLLGDSGEQPPVALRLLGAPAPLRVEAPLDAPAPAVRRAAGPAAEPPGTRLRVVPDAEAGTGVDAVLLTDPELPLLRRYLMGRPLAEQAFLALGDGTHLLVDASGWVASVPFGVPLRRVGPGACFVQSGHALTPPLPPGARIRSLGLRAGVAVVCREAGRSEFRLDPLVPVWTLWAPEEPPAVPPALSRTAHELLTLFETLMEDRAGRTGPGDATAPPGAPEASEALRGAEGAEEDPTTALARAARLRAEGHLPEAAEAFRTAGDPLQAGRLFEQAALRLGEAE
ncbi:hypothetical protein [Streptomyces griseus]|uniref:hypothetical protein n=1 Tax=Streptomyces griseus TaxID=1911 RepID=UPI000563F639|nr:hypothetical protein [Streptomyces griseus]